MGILQRNFISNHDRLRPNEGDISTGSGPLKKGEGIAYFGPISMKQMMLAKLCSSHSYFCFPLSSPAIYHKARNKPNLGIIIRHENRDYY